VGSLTRRNGGCIVLFMITSKVTKRGQTTLPRQVRDALKVKPGQSLVYEVRGTKSFSIRTRASSLRLAH
jgi:bifunctional DNA-binding transcriptional regulator/antitoxin component of YhaV-PrlF toxin-antitoxin module